MSKRIIILLFVLVFISCFAYAQQRNPTVQQNNPTVQQITRVAVVDLPRVYSSFLSESRAVRQFEERSANVQAEVNRRTAEIQQLRSRHAEAVLNDDQSEANRLEGQIHRQVEALRTYHQTQTAILETERRNLVQSGSFMNQVYDEIRHIAESEGISIVLDSKANDSILWFSPSIDITNRLIQSLRSRR